MSLAYLETHGFRNLQHHKIEPGPSVNLIHGENASGKTSLLEAIYFLSHARSFITHKINDVIHIEKKKLILFSRILTETGRVIPVGLEHDKQTLNIRIDNRSVQRVSELARQLPVIVLHPDSHLLINGGPKYRRQFIDWGLFHVEQSFYPTWQRYQKALKQRNAALRSHQPDRFFQAWDQELIYTADLIDTLRIDYLSSLQRLINELSPQIFENKTILIDYHRGWNRETPLGDVLNQNLMQDRERGFTLQGPHRADLKIRINGLNAQTAISRGQQKILVVLLRLAQAILFNQSSSRQCVILFDDLPAELDSQHRHRLLSIMANIPVQLFITSIESQSVDLSLWQDQKMFHVEHGVVTEVI